MTIEGAKGSFYEGEKFKLRFHFDHTYPMHPPEVRPETDASPKLANLKLKLQTLNSKPKFPEHAP